MPQYKIIQSGKEYELMVDLSDHSFRFIQGMAESALTHHECGEVLEDQLQERFPWIKAEEIFDPGREKYTDMKDYCHYLLSVGEKHQDFIEERMAAMERSNVIGK